MSHRGFFILVTQSRNRVVLVHVDDCLNTVNLGVDLILELPRSPEDRPVLVSKYRFWAALMLATR